MGDLSSVIRSQTQGGIAEPSLSHVRMLPASGIDCCCVIIVLLKCRGPMRTTPQAMGGMFH
ncbi:hypothetical protein CEV34_1106 [Brucella pseudogrignonensis]|uniref:Uncharacterized protein n=1 Tax=Brucella pseudogrignonensis TaxID=419475 RepID=A0A256GMY8_9HYPH|nr:hypothetical protein CEV34_1106 [Brucella pseudogrignonensis]